MAASGPLTHSQTQIWLGQRLAPESPLYNMAFAFVFPPGLRTEIFVEAWRRIVAASDVLRTRVVEETPGDPRWTLSLRGPDAEIAEPIRADDPAGAFHAWCGARCGRPLALDGDLVDSVLVPFADGRTGWYLNQHHLVADAQSTVLLYRATAAAYESLLRGDVPASGPLPSYYETVVSLPTPAIPASSRSDSAVRVSHATRTLPLYGRPARPAGTASTRLTLRLDERRSRALDARAGEPGLASLAPAVSRLALFSTLLASWLRRITGETALAFDMPVGGRPTPTARRSLGVFIELFPFSVTAPADDTFAALASRCLAESIRLVQQALPGTSSPTTAGANSVVLNYLPVSFGPFAGLRPEVEWIHSGHGDAVHALRVQVHDFAGDGRYTLHFDFNDGALEDRLRRRSLEHFDRMVEAFLEGPDRPVDSIDIRTAEERRACAALNDTGARPLPRDTVVTMFERTAAGQPDVVALREGPRTLTFGELRAAADAVAAALEGRGVVRGDRVAIAGRRSIETVVGILAALRAGAVYVPIDPAAPRARVEYLLRDCGARVLLADGVRSLALPGGIEMLEVAATVAARRGEAPTVARPDLTDLAYLLYTSGSTGLPKGVLIEHAGLADYLQWAERRYVRGERLTYALCTSLAFDLTVTCLFLPLVTGGTLEIYPEPDGPVDSSVLDVAARRTADFVKLTPSHLSLLRSLGLDGSPIRRLVLGGEQLRTSLASAVQAQLPDGAEIYNEYGPTEAVVGCIAHRYDSGRDLEVSVPIGTPADHVSIEILNAQRTPVLEGVPGELWISRYGLARGYHGRAELTAERFPEDPAHPGRRRYRTGDLVRLLDPGTLEYLGRMDRQVKIAGHRVEPGEVEAALQDVPGVEQAAVVLRRRAAAGAGAAAVTHCVRCGLPSNYPRASFNPDGVCSICVSYAAIEPNARAYFRTMDDLARLFEQSRAAHPGAAYDCLMLYSGGKDSTYALLRLVQMGLSVYAFTLDNGFISNEAKANIRRVTGHLGVAVEFGTTPGMPEIFRDSLARFSNVCNGCFKTIYTLGLLRARELGAPIVVTGLSRGQMFETRLSEEMFSGGSVDAADVDAAVLAARKAYHRTPDAVSKVIDVRPFQEDGIFDEIRVVDFYRYCDVPLGDMLTSLAQSLPWVRPADTGRSTNCLINDLGIYVHQQERGFHSYALPYSWDVRLGHKTREAALQELDDEIDPAHVRRMLQEIGYDEGRVAAVNEQAALAGFYVSPQHLSEDDVRRQLAQRLPSHLVPALLQRADAIPLTPNGKVDEQALLQTVPDAGTARAAAYAPPDGPVAEFLAGVWEEQLGIARVGSDDSFFALGGTSLLAMQMMVRLCREFDITLPLSTVFTHPRLGELARIAEDRLLADTES